MGACGVIWVAGHVTCDQLMTMVAAVERGDLEAARESFAQQLPAIDAIMGTTNYGASSAKAELELIGVLDNRRVRLPQVELSNDEVELLRQGLLASGSL